ncbi:peptidoglycan-associated lipoprotein Pal [Candidatus Berkiella cookevillensis]|uniref:Peptidoglycan-associated lipoprotein n=2 Tax=Candidatus Berkiella cookevillensis TaxID=437022 RepID=A0AAE3HSU7_9GAMM|nr:peptidoglycan-associated lipoprotein Pal [Candidatus Berkiella cookevillensis]MCS5709465.1 peptidoglycan-associated lipoprotein Pal [Candidatus Berkiella cookevillensis]
MMSIKGAKICLVGIALSMMVVGCSNKGASNRHASHGGDSTYAANAYGAGEGDAFDGRNLTDSERELLAKRKFFFDFDRDDIKSYDQASLNAHANYLKNNHNKVIRIEGHTDEQGSREYNVGLGERRGNAVSRFLMSNGVSPSQINVVSYGAEKPEAMGSGEDAYRQNRRAIIVYEQ